MSGPKHIDSIKRHEMRHPVTGAARTLTPSEAKKLAIGALSSLKQELLLSRPALSSLLKENLALFDSLLNNTSSLLSTLWQENKLSAGTKKAVTNLLAQLDLAAKDTVGLQLNGKTKNLIANVMDALSQLQPEEKKSSGTRIAGLPYSGPDTVNPIMQATIIPAGLSFAAFNLNLSIPAVSLFTPLTQIGNRSVKEQRAVYHRFTLGLIQVEESNPASEVLSVALAERVNDTFFREATRRGKETEKQLQAAFEKALQEVQAEFKRINVEIAQTRESAVKSISARADNVSVEFLSTEISLATVASRTGEAVQINIAGKLTTPEIALATTALLSHLPAQEALGTLAVECTRIAREIPRHEVELQNLTAQIVSQFTGQPIANLPTVANQANLPANLNIVTGKTSPVLTPEARVVATIVSALVAALAVPKEEAKTIVAATAQTGPQQNQPTLTIDQTTYTGPQVSAPSQAPERASTVFTSATSVGQAKPSEPAVTNAQTVSEPARIVELIRVVSQQLPAASLPALMAEATKITSNPAVKQAVETIIIAAASTKEGQKYVMEAARQGETAPLLSPASEVGSRVIVETVKALIDPKARLQEAKEAQPNKPTVSGKASPVVSVTEQVAQLATLVINTNKIAPTALTAEQAKPILEFVAQAQQARQTIKETQAQIAKDIKDGKLPAPAKPGPLSRFNPIQGKPRTAANPKQIETIVNSLGTLAKSAQKMEAAGLKVPNAIMQSISAGLSGLNLVPAQMTNPAKAPESKPAPRGQLDSFVKVLEAEIERLQTVATTTSTKAPTRFVAWQVQAQIEAIIISIQAAAANESKIKKILKELEEQGLLEKVLKALKDGDTDSVEAARDAIYQMRLIVNTREIEFNRAA